MLNYAPTNLEEVATMKRKLEEKLISWKRRSNRHPLVLRGARQVGKTYLVREFAKSSFKYFIEVNFEEDESLVRLFESRNPEVICELLASRFSVPVKDGQTLLFLDELQAAEPYVFESLRYFYEKRPGLHVIAAGSLLEFMLDAATQDEKKAFPMPVGRIEYMYLGPLDFEEFLFAGGRTGLVEWLAKYSVGNDVPDALHKELSLWLRRYLVVGGMPAAVKAYVGDGLEEAEREQDAILSTYHDDFPKYGKRANAELLQKVFLSVPHLLGRKLIYSHIDPGEKSNDMSKAFSRLALSRIVAKVCHTPANAVPIGAFADTSTFKPLFLDVGLACHANGLNLDDFIDERDLMLANKGEICEQFVGQHILHSGKEYETPSAYCWIREARGAASEVDYIIQIGSLIVPIEVKSGKTGSLKSLNFFLNEKHLPFAVRLNAEKPSLLVDAQVSDSLGRTCRYSLLSIPLYMICQLKRLSRDGIEKCRSVVGNPEQNRIKA